MRAAAQLPHARATEALARDPGRRGHLGRWPIASDPDLGPGEPVGQPFQVAPVGSGSDGHGAVDGRPPMHRLGHRSGEHELDPALLQPAERGQGDRVEMLEAWTDLDGWACVDARRASFEQHACRFAPAAHTPS